LEEQKSPGISGQEYLPFFQEIGVGVKSDRKLSGSKKGKCSCPGFPVYRHCHFPLVLVYF
jgi:hypothetical protein